MDCLHLKATLIEDNSLLLLCILCSLVITWGRGKFLFRILGLLQVLSDREAFNLLDGGEVLLKTIDLTLTAHFDEKCLRFVLFEHANRRQLVASAHDKHHLRGGVGVSVC